MRQRLLTTNDSSHLSEVIFYPDAQQLCVRFVSGAMYRYRGVNANIFGRLASADSMGAEFADSIRFNPNIHYEEMKEWPLDDE